jgi:hypothetical protein
MQPLEGFEGSDFSEQVPVGLAVVIDKGDTGLGRLGENHCYTSSLGLFPLIYSIGSNKRGIIVIVFLLYLTHSNLTHDPILIRMILPTVRLDHGLIFDTQLTSSSNLRFILKRGSKFERASAIIHSYYTGAIAYADSTRSPGQIP